MPLCRFLCLALSRRDGGYCIAGLDLDTGQWVRPLNPKTYALNEADIFIRESSTSALRPMRIFDIVALPLERAISNSAQPENWLLQALPPNTFPQLLASAQDNAQKDPGIFQLLCQMATDNATRPFLFGDRDASVAHQQLVDHPLPGSLSLIRPLDLVWVRSDDYRGHPRIKADFRYGLPRQRYYLPVTDIEYERRLLNATEQGCPRLRATLAEPHSEILFTASLGENFATTHRHYKLIAGVLEIPR